MSTRSRWTLAVAVCLVVVAAVFYVARSSGGSVPSAPESVPGSSPSLTTVSPTPTPTESETPSAPARASAPPAPVAPVAPTVTASAKATAAPAPAPSSEVRVVVTASGRNTSTGAAEARGFAEVVESGGLCTLRLTHGSALVEQVTDAVADATTTSCGTVSVLASQLSAGTWTGVLLYRSATSSGESLPFTIEVP
jgi:cytoskeletal protein RodZ